MLLTLSTKQPSSRGLCAILFQQPLDSSHQFLLPHLPCVHGVYDLNEYIDRAFLDTDLGGKVHLEEERAEERSSEFGATLMNHGKAHVTPLNEMLALFTDISFLA